MSCCAASGGSKRPKKRDGRGARGKSSEPPPVGEMSTTAVADEELRWRETAFAEGAKRMRQLKSAGKQAQFAPRDYASVNDDMPDERFDVKNFKIVWGKASKYEVHWNQSLGEGAFGAVYKARNKASGEVCVAKTIKVEKERASAIQQEVKMAQLLAGGPNIVRLLDTVKTETGLKILVFEFLENPKYRKVFKHMSDLEARHYLYQLLLALNYCHSQGIVHRDVKAGNVIYDPKTRDLRLIDLGFCAFFLPAYEWTSWPGTRSYKAPELFLHYKHYDYQSDIWSFACIMGQIVFQRKSMFESDRAGDDHELGNYNHMVAVVRAMGTRAYGAWLEKYGVASGLRAKYPVSLFKTERCKSSRVNFAMLTNRRNKHLALPEAVDLLDQLLVLDQEQRLTSREALLHRYFDPVRTIPHAAMLRHSLLSIERGDDSDDEIDDLSEDDDDGDESDLSSSQERME